MICYRAETAFSNILAAEYKKKTNEIRALVKSILFSKADIIPDAQNNVLNVHLYNLATPRDIQALANVCQLLNDTETVYPGTNLKLFFEMTTY